jgi:alanine racemase
VDDKTVLYEYWIVFGDYVRIARMQMFRSIQHSMVQVDLGAVNHNCRIIRAHIGEQCQLCAVVKADGYGLGATKVASQLGEHAELLAVYSPDEAGELLVSGVTTPILVLSPVHSVDRFHPMYHGLTRGDVQLVVHGVSHLESIIQLAKRIGRSLPVQVKVDTGLHRGGCGLQEATSLIEMIRSHQMLELKGVMTHFISAVHDEELTRVQHNRFNHILQSLSSPLPDDCLLHEANTAGTVQWKWTHRNMVRVGLAWTGAVPVGVAPLQDILPVVTWRTRLAHLKCVKSHEQVGYSGKWTATRPSRIGIVPVGYAAGYPMGVGAEGDSEGAFVRVYDEQFKNVYGDAPVIGSVCMDQIAIDLTDIPDCGIAHGIELISSNEQSKATLTSLSAVAGVVPHAIISRISSKVHRTYLEVQPTTNTSNQKQNVSI